MGCESLNNKSARWPGKKPAVPEQLANDLSRRAATEKQVAQATGDTLSERAVQHTNFTPSATDSDPILLQAKQAEQAQQNQIAKTMYEQVLQKQPLHAEAHHRLGVLADQEGRYEEAQRHYNTAEQQEPQNASLLSDIGYSYYSQDRLDEAEKYLLRSLQIQPGNLYARNNLGHVYGRRAQQSGSAEHYKLAEEQFMLAVGPQRAEAQMKQLFPQGVATADASNANKSGLLNPFKKSEKGGARRSSLLAPKPKTDLDGTAKLQQQMDQIRQEMEARGELPKGSAAGNPQLSGRPSIGAVPPNKLIEAIQGIDQQAEYERKRLIQESYPELSGRGSQGPNGGMDQGGRVRQVGAEWEDQRESPHLPINRGAYQEGGDPRGNQQFGGPSGAYETYGQPNGMNYGGQKGTNQSYPAGYPQPDMQGQGGAGEYNSYQDGRGPDAGNSPPGQGQGQQGPQDAVNFTPSWPDQVGSPVQFDAQGIPFSNDPVINYSTPGRPSNNNGQQNNPNYWSGNGPQSGPQRPNGGNRANPNEWNQGRAAAAQLGLDAGMGEMFPGSDGDSGMNRVNQAGYPQTGPRNGPQGGFQWNTGATNATTPRGMPQGGNGMMSPADYSQAPPSFQNSGYSRGVNPAQGENFAQPGGDVSAPWNHAPTMPRNNRNVQQMQYGNDAGGAASGQFAPNRQTGYPQTQNLGTPPMYYGR